MSLISPDVSLETLLCEGLNPQQREAVMAPIDMPLQVMAGAGTGKTELITRRFVKLVLDLAEQGLSEGAEHLWVSTFTEKAAREMAQRIESYLLRVTGSALSSRAWIGTFHGLCHRILQQHQDKMPHLKDFVLLSDVELELFREGLIQALLTGTLEKASDKLQRESLAHLEDCLNLKSLVMLDIGDYERFFSEVVFGVIPRIKASGLSPVLFYQQAMAQAQSYADLIRRVPISDPVTGQRFTEHETFATHWQRHLNPVSHASFSFFPTDWEIELESEKAIRKQKEPPEAIYLLRESLKPFYKEGCFVSYNGRKKNDPFSHPVSDFTGLEQALALEQKIIGIVSAVYALYQQALRDEKACDYDDLIQETLQLLTDFPDVRTLYQQHFRHFMVDEFQDSNGGQLQLVQLLTGQENPSVTVVGDKKQSIYGFRFAEPENLHVLFQEVPKAKTIALQTNYRSQLPILSLANRVTEMMELPPQEFLNLPEVSQGDDTNEVTWFSLEDPCPVSEARALEVRWIAESIADLLMTEQYLPSEIAILVRDHRKALQIEEALESMGIPAIKQRNLGFFQSPVIQQAMALLALADDPEQDLPLVNLLQQKLTHRELYLLATLRQRIQEDMGLKTKSYYETLLNLSQDPLIALQELEPVLPILMFLVEFLNQCQAKKEQLSPQCLFSWMLQQFPLLSPEEIQKPEGQKALKQLETLKKILYHWVERARKPMTLTDMLEMLKRCQERDELALPVEEEQFDEDAVRIMTIHGAKGLEFPVVFLAGVDMYRRSRFEGLLTVDPQYPGKMGVGLFLNRYQEEKTLKKLVYDTVWKIPRSVEEELRLFYVGVTRAKSRLFVSSWPRSFPYMNPRFFRDLPVTRLTSDDILWKTPEELSRVTLIFQGRFRRMPQQAESQILRMNAQEISSERLVVSSLLPVITLESLMRFRLCSTQGVLNHLYPRLSPHAKTEEGVSVYCNAYGNAWIRFDVAGIESTPDGSEQFVLDSQGFELKRQLLLTQYPHLTEEKVVVRRDSGAATNPICKENHELLQMLSGDLDALTISFLSVLSTKNPFPKPNSRDIPCCNCPYQALCPYFKSS